MYIVCLAVLGTDDKNKLQKIKTMQAVCPLGDEMNIFMSFGWKTSAAMRGVVNRDFRNSKLWSQEWALIALRSLRSLEMRKNDCDWKDYHYFPTWESEEDDILVKRERGRERARVRERETQECEEVR